MPAFTEKKYLTPRELATRWGYSPRAIRRACSIKSINAIKLLGDWRITIEEVERIERTDAPTVVEESEPVHQSIVNAFRNLSAQAQT